MTLRSLKKPQTTPPNTRAETTIDERESRIVDRGGAAYLNSKIPLPVSTIPLRQDPLWMPAGLLAVLLMLVSALSAVGGEVYDSGWSSTTHTAGTRHAPKSIDYRIPPNRAAHQPLLPNQSSQRAKIRLVAFDDEQHAAPSPRFAKNGRARLRSVVVESGGARRSFRVAQESIDDDLMEGFDSPYGADEELPPADELPPVDRGQSDWNDPGIEDPTEPGATEPERDWDSDLGAGIEDPFEKDERDSTRQSPSDNTVAPRPDIERVLPEDIGPPRSRERRSEGSELAESQKNCSEELAELKASRIAEIDLNIVATGTVGEDYPYECSINDGTPYADRCWPEVVYMWKATALCHKPLYFENVQLERYGHSWGPALQPLVSGVHFFARIPALPYCMGLKAPNECVYTLGHYRPGSCAPYLIEPVPFTFRAAAWEAAAVTGGIFVIP